MIAIADYLSSRDVRGQLPNASSTLVEIDYALLLNPSISIGFVSIQVTDSTITTGLREKQESRGNRVMDGATAAANSTTTTVCRGQILRFAA